ncbi:MAG TPA: ATP-binding cassette domain-containing protein [Dermatophilaceae bacterium]|nr:ATP-binding cassette domain-containing protein [Dermatophilaceae bacterium]
MAAWSSRPGRSSRSSPPLGTGTPRASSRRAPSRRPTPRVGCGPSAARCPGTAATRWAASSPTAAMPPPRPARSSRLGWGSRSMWDMRATTRCRAAVVSMPEASTPARQIAADGIPAVDVVDLTKDYRRPRVSLTTPGPVVHALRGVSLQVAQGQRFGIVGESGCGKSTLLRILAGLEQPSSGRVAVMGQAVTGRTERSLRFLRENLQLVFQDPMSSLDPRMRVRDIVAEPLVGLRLGGDHAARVAELLSAVGLDPDVADRYPHQFSGGQRQRISIARALAPSPGILLADEPVSALDVSVRAQVLNVLSDLVDTYALTLVLVSHDLGVVRHVCGRVAVMKGGQIVETGPTAQVYDAPTHPYTQALVAAVPTIGKALSGERAADLAAGVRRARDAAAGQA